MCADWIACLMIRWKGSDAEVHRVRAPQSADVEVGRLPVASVEYLDDIVMRIRVKSSVRGVNEPVVARSLFEKG